MKKIISVLLVFVLTFGVCWVPGNKVAAEENEIVTISNAAAPTPTPYGTAPTPKAANQEMPSNFTYGLTTSKLNTFLGLIDGAIKSNTATINVYSYKIPHNSYTENLFFDELFCNPEYFNIKTYTYSYSGDGYLYQIYFYYSLDNATYLKQLAQCESVADHMLEGIENSNLSVYAQLLLLHDRIATWTEYDYEGLKIYSGWTDPPYTIYGVLVRQLAVCQGYSMAYKYLLNRLGIENYICSSADLFHAWNIVKVNGNYYHVDITWDDPSYLNQSTGKYVRAEGLVRHDNFLISTNEIRNTGHNAYDFSALPTDTYFDDFWWEDSFAEFTLLNGSIYYILNRNAAGNAKLYKSDTTLNNNVYLTTVKDIWYDKAFGNNWSYYDSFARLSTNGETLYVSGDKEIYKYNPSSKTLTTVATLPTGSATILGFKVDHNLIYYTTVYGNSYSLCQYQFKSLPTEECLIFRTGRWVYIKNGSADYTAETLVKHNGDLYYVKNGIADFGATKLYNYKGTWYYVKNGIVDFGATTLVYNNNAWYYVRNGKVDFGATTLIYFNDGWYYVRNGKVDFTATTLIYFNDGWYYVNKGKVDFGARTLIYFNNAWYYVNKGKVDFNAKTLIYFNNDWYYVENGKVNFNAKTLVYFNNAWYYVNKGKVDFNAKTLIYFNDGWYYVENGKVNFNAKTLVKFDNTWYYVNKGKVDFNATTLVYFYNDWYYVQKGKVNFNATTLHYFNNTWYYVRYGKVNFKEVVLIKFNNKIYFVRNGKVEFSYTGYVLCEGKRYYVRNGVVV